MLIKLGKLSQFVEGISSELQNNPAMLKQEKAELVLSALYSIFKSQPFLSLF